MLILILMVIAFVLFLISGATFLPPPSQSWPWRYSFIALGLACWVLAEILKAAPLLSR